MRKMKKINELSILATLALGVITFMSIDIHGLNYSFAAEPASSTITAKLTDTLKSITADVSSSIEDSIDEVIAGTMDILIDNTMDKLANATIYSNTSNEAQSNVDMQGIPQGYMEAQYK
jgi:hypothetical protein